MQAEQFLLISRFGDNSVTLSSTQLEIQAILQWILITLAWSYWQNINIITIVCTT